MALGPRRFFAALGVFAFAVMFGGSPMALRGGFVMSPTCPVYPKQQTFLDPVGTSHLCHERKLIGCLNVCRDAIGSSP